MTNAVLLLLDSLRYDHVTTRVTPNLFKASKKGVFYKYALACNSATVKSIPCILSASFEYSPVDNIPTILKQEGYTTAAFHSSPLFGQHFSNGFDLFEDLHSQTLSSNRRMRRFARKFLPRTVFTKIKEVVRTVSDSEKYLPYMRASKTLQIVSEWMKTAAEPYFLWIHLMDPHLPYYPEKEAEFTKRELIKFNDKIVEAAYRRKKLSREDVEQAKILYRKEVSEMDEAFGEFFKTLNRKDILIITSDHGEEFGEFLDFSHQEDKIIPSLLHVPLIMVGGDLESKVCEDDFSHLELAPLIFKMLGVEREIGIWKTRT